MAATHLINLLPTAMLSWKTPYENLMENEPKYDHLRVIGCLCYGSGSKKPRDKFAKRDKEYIINTAKRGISLWIRRVKRCMLARM